MRIDTSDVMPPFLGKPWLARTAILMHQNADNYRRHKQHCIVPDQRMKLATTRKTDQVIASARKELEAQLTAVRDEIARLTAEERALTHAVSNFDGGNPATSAAGTASKRPCQHARRRAGKRRAQPASEAHVVGAVRARGASQPPTDWMICAGCLATGRSPAAISRPHSRCRPRACSSSSPSSAARCPRALIQISVAESFGASTAT